ncbi:flagellar basal-body MS-ring/collar protein FliF [Pelagibacterium halotolerans]|uniref:Flagellar M-ring protein n=1 Tax=Pelagibacterium halotolerans (strain DSM 22347 / JCM 15775 / CGMCC 1.7692 / B2) TaxID=1082931 RepID=G4R930_PELHB|nr:flagellar M-ring protein FliF [Pelagibacterium halotolerans B2]QJR17859.1 flagellar M-ring protein FliF [Pelagibacterium halotolerans]SEA35584.1 flagellar M-ring protein FliF [Pelagibacterium halotolerans]
MNQLGELLSKLGVARIAAMAVVAVMILGFFAFIMIRSTTPQLAPLYTNLEFDDSAAIIAELGGMGIPYEIRNEGATLLVPRDQITTIRMSLAQDGLPARGQVGYEIFDNQSTLGATSFVQNINHIRALEGELARTIGGLSRVQSARVHLVLPERELFRRDIQEPSASIVLTVRGQLSAGEIRAVQHLVASAIEGLSPNAVSIVDSAGSLLASGSGEGEVSITAQAVEERTLGVETRMRSRLEELLASVVGLGRARVQVSAELDLNRSTRTSETFDPDGQVVRSAQTVETGDQSSGPGGAGQVTVANELPGATEQGGEGGTQSSSTSLEETMNYEISSTTETQVTEAGSIKRMSVAVVVDGVYTYDAAGNAIYEPRPQAELDQITALVRTAMGYDADRGDQIEVVNMQFAERPGIEAGTAEPGLFEFSRDDLMKFAEMAVTLLIALALVLFVMRPLVKKVLTPEPQPLALPEAASVPAEYQEPQEDPMAAARAREAATEAWLETAKSLGESQVKALKMVGELVEESPKQASLIIRDWLSEAA